jgi:mannose-1-phosphate guanylyltransferase
MQAMILAAGLGMRLRPITERRPKALVPVANTPIIDRTIAHLKSCGVSGIIVNAHHHHRQILDRLDGGRPYGLPIQVRVEPEILGTGGGIRNTIDFWGDEPFIAINVDILTDIDLIAAYETHLAQGNPVTLVLHDRPEFSKVRLDDRMNIAKIHREVRPGGLAFTGIHIISPGFLERFPASGKFDIIDCYRGQIKAGTPIGAYVAKGHYWRDIGALPDYMQANRDALGTSVSRIGEGGMMHESSKIRDWAVIGKGTVIGPEAVITRSVIWEKATIARGVRVTDSVVTADREVTSDLIGEVL